MPSDQPLLLSTTSTDLLRRPESLVHEACRSALYQWQSMANGAAQLVDLNGTLPKLDLIECPKPADTGRATWFAQQAGSAAAIALPFYIANKGLNGLADRAFGKLAQQSLSREVATSAATGFIFGSVFTPVTPGDQRNFYQARLENGLVLGSSVGVMTYSFLRLQNAGNALGAQSPVLGGILKNDFVAGTLSGIPGGLAFSELNALSTHRRLATSAELGESVTNFSIVGGLLAIPGTIKGKAPVPVR